MTARKRRLLFVLASLAAFALVAAASLPLWLGGALRVVGPRFGADFGRYERLGYARFALTDVAVSRPQVNVTAARVELDSPLVWAWRRVTGKPGPVRVSRWRVEVIAPAAASPAAKAAPRGWVPLRARLDRIVGELARWLPPTEADAGEVVWPRGEMRFAGVSWRERALAVERWSFGAVEASVALEWTAGGLVDVRIADARGDWSANLESIGETVSARGEGWAQPAKLRATFAPTGWLPASAELDVPAFDLPGARLSVGELYEHIAGSAAVSWDSRRFTVAVKANGRPVAGTRAPPLAVELRGAGDFDAFTVDRLNVQAPGLTLNLGSPLAVARTGELRGEAAKLALDVDLGAFASLGAQGRVRGEAVVSPRAGEWPTVDLSLDVAEARWRELSILSGELAARVNWPRVELRRVVVTPASGERVEVAGVVDVGGGSLSALTLKGRVTPASVGRWLPRGVEFAVAEFSTQLDGPWGAPRSRGEIRVNAFKSGPLKPLELRGEWSGRALELETFTITARAGANRVELAGAASTEHVDVSALRLVENDVERLALTRPTRVRWRPSLVIELLELSGLESHLNARLAWGARGDVALDAAGIASNWLTPFVELSGPEWQVKSLGFHGAWDDGGVMTFSANASALLALGARRTAEIALSASGDERGVKLETLRAETEGAPVFVGAGAAPLTFRPAAPEEQWGFDEAGPIALSLATSSNAAFWSQLSELIGVTVDDPRATVKLDGSWREPRGEIDLRLARLAADPQRWSGAFPVVENVVARATATRDGVALETLALTIDGQALRASGRLPVAAADWRALAKNPAALREAGGEFRVEIPSAEIAAFARYAPEIIAPSGRLSADLRWAGDGNVTGFFNVTDAATRRLGTLGTLQDIDAEIVFAGKRAELKNVRAMAGGQPLVIAGALELSDAGAPTFDVTVRGENLPFVRQPGLLLRGDLNLRLVGDAAGGARVIGEARLRDSLFLADVRALIPRGGPRSAPSRRPPYFAVDAAPFNAWQLDVAVRGDRFMRLRTPVLTGVGSVRVNLTGTLGEPRAVGEALIDEGEVLLPFATFDVQQASARLTEADPFELRLAMTGASRRYGYDLRMEIGGTATSPTMAFSSSPPLESEQVLLMVMAGETPQNEITYSGRQRAMRLGAYLGQSLLGALGGDSRAAERLTLDVGASVSRQGRETYGLEYRLGERWSLVGEYDEFDDYNVGVKWRVLGGTPPEADPQRKEPGETKR